LKDVPPGDAVFGYMHPSLVQGPLRPDHPDNEPLRHAAALIRAFPHVPGLVLALSDFSAARREPGPYYAFQAFRVLEDVRDAFEGDTDISGWTAMNTALGTSKETWEELTAAGKAARHLRPNDAAGLLDPEKHHRLLTLARDAVTRFVEHLRTHAAKA